jgi:hypothetical protein
MSTCGFCGHPGTHATVIESPGAPTHCTGCPLCEAKRQLDAEHARLTAEHRAMQEAQRPFMEDYRQRRDADLERLRKERDEMEAARQPFMDEFRQRNQAELDRLRRMRDGDC